MIAFLRGPQSRIDHLLGDAVTETLSKILAGAFDGDEQPLRTLLADTTVDPYVRQATLLALAFLCFEARIDRNGFEAFLLQLDEEKLLPRTDDVMWHGWMTAVAVLGMERLVPRVRTAFADGRIAPLWCSETDFDGMLKAAIDRPDDHTRFAVEQMGYIEDVLEALERFHEGNAAFVDDDPITNDELPNWAAARVPQRNPLRGVGRNDPCPCGSGKKAKKCCMQ